MGRRIAVLGVVGALVIVGGVIAILITQPASTQPGTRDHQAGTSQAHHLVVVLGDSMAGTLGIALADTEPSTVRVDARSNFGCGIATGTYASDAPPIRQAQMFPACNESNPASEQWPDRDRKDVQITHPGDIVVYVAGAWECEDILHDGQWSNITQLSFRNYLRAQFNLLIAIATARGAHLELSTLPAVRNGTAADSLVRQRLYDRLVIDAVASHRERVSLLDLAKLFSPRGVFTEYLDGVQVRSRHGLHTPAYDPNDPFFGNSPQLVAVKFNEWFGPRIWPLIMSSARSQ